MFTGTTTIALAMLPSVEKVVALELEGYLKKWSSPYFEQAKVSDKIDVRIGDAVTSLATLQKESASFDLVRARIQTLCISFTNLQRPGVHRCG